MENLKCIYLKQNKHAKRNLHKTASCVEILCTAVSDGLNITVTTD